MKRLMKLSVLLLLAVALVWGTYSADYTLATTGTFQQQVRMAMIHAAISISNEARSTHNTVDTKREQLAQTVLTSPDTWVGPFSYACVETGLSGTPTDAQIDTAIATVWNGLAGVKSGD